VAIELGPEQEAALRELYGETGMTLEEAMADVSAFFGELAADPGPGDVRTTTIESLGLEQGQVFMYLFDYGDEWRFRVRVHAIDNDAPDDAEVPRLVESVGQAPEQYDDEDWEA
jgi:8-oxo-dGTP pyrophosphatase MutT (NUDIX family)